MQFHEANRARLKPNWLDLTATPWEMFTDTQTIPTPQRDQRRQELKKMRVVDLKEFGRQHAIRGYTSLKKEALVELILEKTMEPEPVPEEKEEQHMTLSSKEIENVWQFKPELYSIKNFNKVTIYYHKVPFDINTIEQLFKYALLEMMPTEDAPEHLYYFNIAALTHVTSIYNEYKRTGEMRMLEN